MITYNDLCEAKKNQPFLFESPPNTELWHLFYTSIDTTSLRNLLEELR